MATNPSKKKSKPIIPEPEVTKEEILAGLDTPMLAALEKAGITEDYLTQKLQEELNANDVRVFNDKGKLISEEIPALKIRQEARKDAHKLRGDYPAEKKELSGGITIEELVRDREEEGNNDT